MYQGRNSGMSRKRQRAGKLITRPCIERRSEEMLQTWPWALNITCKYKVLYSFMNGRFKNTCSAKEKGQDDGSETKSTLAFPIGLVK